jgi:hypothetical protein
VLLCYSVTVLPKYSSRIFRHKKATTRSMASRPKSTNCNKLAPVNIRNPTAPRHWSGQKLGRARPPPPPPRAAPRHINCTALPFIGVCCKLLFTVRNVGSTDNRIPHPAKVPQRPAILCLPLSFPFYPFREGAGAVGAVLE